MTEKHDNSQTRVRLYGCFLFGDGEGCDILHGMKPGQPTILSVDSGFAIRVSDLNNKAIAFVHPFDGGWLLAKLKAGEVWLSKLERGCGGGLFSPPTIIVWRDGTPVQEDENRQEKPIDPPVFRKFRQKEPANG